MNRDFPKNFKRPFFNLKLVPSKIRRACQSFLERIQKEKQTISEGKTKEEYRMNLSFTEGIILIMKSVVMRKYVLMKNCPLKFKGKLNGVSWRCCI